MRIAKLVGEDQNPCYSRHIGVVIVNPEENKIVSTGYNGPPKGTPHCDEYDYLEQIVYPMMSEVDKEKINITNHGAAKFSDTFARQFAKCGQCPRKLLGFKSGEKSEMCSCQHGERNAITNSNGQTQDCYMFCWCGIPCWGCAGAIVNAGISKIFVVKNITEYDIYPNLDKAKWLMIRAGVEIFEKSEGFYLENLQN